MVALARKLFTDFSSLKGDEPVMARWPFRGSSRSLPWVVLVVLATASVFPTASAISGGHYVSAQAGQVTFTAALLADTGLSADNGDLPPSASRPPSDKGVSLASGSPSARATGTGSDEASRRRTVGKGNTGRKPIGPALAAGRLLCGGTLVNRSWILTAKHCARGGLVVRLGSANSMSGGTLHRVIASTSYPDGSLSVDAALLKIDPPASSNGVPLASPAELKSGQVVGLLGWGMSAPGSGTSTSLKQVEVRVVASSKCTGVNAAELCVADPQNLRSSACFGDSGGPAVVRRGASFVLAGLASRAGGISSTCEGSTVYVAAPYVSSWVMRVISGGA